MWTFGGLWSDLENALEKKLDLVTEKALYCERQDDPLRVKLRDAFDKDRRVIYDK